MESNRPPGQQQPLVKKEPIRVRSYSSLRQRDQHHVAAGLWGRKVPAQVNHSSSKYLVTPASSPQVATYSGSGGRETVKFVPNVAPKPEIATPSGAGAAAAAGPTGLGVEALLLRAVHSRQSAQQEFGQLRKSKMGGAVRPSNDSAQPQQLPKSSVGDAFSKLHQKKQRQRSDLEDNMRGLHLAGLSNLAIDASQGDLLLPISLPFKLQQHNRQQQQLGADGAEEGLLRVKADQTQQRQQQAEQDALQEVDTAASTPSNWRSSTLRQRDPEATAAAFSSTNTPAALLLQGQRLSQSGDALQENERPEFVQLCFPELFPPLDIAAMQAMQAKQTQPKEQQLEMKNNYSIREREHKGSEPTPMQALPSGRIGQLLIRRSGRVHLRLLTEASPAAGLDTRRFLRRARWH